MSKLPLSDIAFVLPTKQLVANTSARCPVFLQAGSAQGCKRRGQELRLQKSHCPHLQLQQRSQHPALASSGKTRLLAYAFLGEDSVDCTLQSDWRA